MYNRYIPQPDGTYRRNRMQDPQFSANQTRRQVGQSPEQPREASAQLSPQEEISTLQRKQKHTPAPSAGSFLRQLLPGNLDTEDLLVILLLLLMAGETQDDRNNALLTLALYLFL